MTPAAKLAARYLNAAPTQKGPQRLDPQTKARVNKALVKVGLDGNGNFVKADRGYAAAVEVLQDFDIELDDIANSFEFLKPSGRLNLHIAFTNPVDSFSPVQISNSVLVVTFHQRESGNFEVLAYLS